MIIHSRYLLILGVFLFGLSGCKQTPDTVDIPESNQPDAITEVARPSLPSSIAIMPFSNKTENQDAPDLLRRTLYGHLARTNYEFPHVNSIDSRLAILDPNYIVSVTDTPMLSELLGVEGILYGNVVDYSTIYAGLYAEIAFEVEVLLVNNQGQTVWENSFQEISREGGVSTTPWGLLYNMAVTAMHLDDENMYAVADKLGRTIANEIPQPEGFQSNRGSFIESVIHNGANDVLKYGDVLKVGIKGDANKQASVSIAGIDEVFSLQETSPGVYLADIAIAADWNVSGKMLTGYLHNSNGATSKAISPAGLINIDNIAPEPIYDVSLSSDPKQLTLRWQHAEPEASFAVYLKSVVGQRLLAQTSQKTISIEHQSNAFDSIELAIIAIDQAGNESETKEISQKIYPLASLYDAVKLLDKRLPENLDGQLLMRKQDGPFLIDRQTILSSGSNLYIEPGTVLEFSSSGNLLVKGSFYTFGEEPIVLKPVSDDLTAQTFISINSREHVELNGINIRGAGIAVEVLNGKVLMRDCVISASQYSALVVKQAASVNMQRCRLQGSNTSAVVVMDQAKLKINESELLDSIPFHIQSSSIYEIDATNNKWSPDASPMTVLGNVRF